MDSHFSNAVNKIKTQIKDQKTYLFDNKKTLRRINTQCSQFSRSQTKTIRQSMDAVSTMNSVSQQKVFNKSQTIKTNQISNKLQNIKQNRHSSVAVPFTDQNKNNELQINTIKVKVKKYPDNTQNNNEVFIKREQELKQRLSKDLNVIQRLSSFESKQQKPTQTQRRRASVQNQEIKGIHLNLMQLRNQRRQSLRNVQDIGSIQNQFQQFENFHKQILKADHIENNNDKEDTSLNSKKIRKLSFQFSPDEKKQNTSKFEVNDSFLPKNFQNFSPDSFSNV